MRHSLRFAFLLLSLSSLSDAQVTQLPPRQTVVKVLVPIRIGDFAGASDSLWRNELWIHNENEVTVSVFRLHFIPAPCPPLCGGMTLSIVPDKPIPPHTTVQIAASEPVISNQVGEFFYVDRSSAPAVYFELRSHDENRNSVSAGTEVPVVTEAAARHVIEFLSVPVSSNLRYMLRIYTFGFDPNVPAANRVRFFDGAAGTLLADAPLQFNGFEGEGPTSYTAVPFPNAIPIDLLGDPRLASAKSLRIEVESTFYVFWGFLTVTNNTTNETTIVSQFPGA